MKKIPTASTTRSIGRRAQALIRKLGLLPHPEGGFYREIHRGAEEVRTARGPRSALTTIYFLLPRGAVSRFHRVESDEVWHHYEGAPLRLLRMDPELRTKEEIRLGPLDAKTAPLAVIPRGHWQAAESRGDYTLVGCTVGPGFDFADFRLIDGREAERLNAFHPALARFA
jgi:predicted cupin superfamily sugar epimerase